MNERSSSLSNSSFSENTTKIVNKRKVDEQIRNNVLGRYTEEEGFHICNLCNSELKHQEGNTFNLKRHLEKVHNIDVNTPPKQIRYSQYDKYILQWIVTSSSSIFNTTNNFYFRLAQEFLKSDILIPNGHRLDSLFKQQFLLEIDSISQFLNKLNGKINLIVDCWSDYSFNHYMGICCSFIYNGKIKTLALSFEPTQDQSAKDLEKLIEKCLNTYKIGDRINSLVTDNGITYIELANVNLAMSAELESWAERNNVFYKSSIHWIRCSTHIINIAVNKLLASLEDIIKPFRKNLVSIRRSFLLTYKLKRIQKEMKSSTLRVIVDNATRWGSTYNMIVRSFMIRKSIDELIKDEVSHKNLHGLTEIEERTWAIVFILQNYLNRFNEATIMMQGEKYSTLNMRISMYIELVKFSKDFLNLGIEYNLKKEFINGINSAILTIEKYFNKGSFTSFMSMVLDPRLKDSVYIKSNWGEDFDYMFNKMNEYFIENYSKKQVNSRSLQVCATEINSMFSLIIGENDTLLSEIIKVFKNGDIAKKKLSDTIYCPGNYSELQLYLKEKPIVADYYYDIIDYWYRQKNSPLRQMALDILSTPGSSCTVERLFSMAKKDDSPLHQSLNTYKKGELQILKSYWNLQRDIILERNT